MSESKGFDMTLTPQAAERVRKIQEYLGYLSIPDTTRACYRIVEWMMQQQTEGRQLMVEEDGIITPFTILTNIDPICGEPKD